MTSQSSKDDDVSLTAMLRHYKSFESEVTKMTTLTLELPSELYQRLDEEAERLNKPAQVLAQEWLVERLATPPPTLSSEREKAREVLRAAGLLTELGPTLRQMADTTVRPEDVEAALARAGGKPLSEIVLEQRGPKE